MKTYFKGECMTKEVLARRVLELKPSGIRKFFDIAATMEDVISLGIGEPDFTTPEPIIRAGVFLTARRYSLHLQSWHPCPTGSCR